MNRRGFLAGLASIPVAVAAGDLLWRPGKTISLPPKGLTFYGVPIYFDNYGGFDSGVNIVSYDLQRHIVHFEDATSSPIIDLIERRMIDASKSLDAYLREEHRRARQGVLYGLLG